jgi:hypothetical protein
MKTLLIELSPKTNHSSYSVVNLNKNDVRLITESNKRELNELNKEIEIQEKAITQVKENLLKL